MLKAALVACLPCVAMANCGEYAVMSERLAGHYGEAKVSAGLQTDVKLIEVWANLDKGTFTVLAVYSVGRACVIAHGKDFRQFALETGERL